MPNLKTTKSATKLSAEEQEARKKMLASMEATSHVSPSVDSGALAMDISQNVIEKISAMMDSKFEEFSAALNTMTTRLESNTRRITEAESRISTAEDAMSAFETKITGLEEKVRYLTEKCADMEGRSRRDNILIYNLKENTEGSQPVKFFESWLPTLLNLETKRGIIKIDRAHRSLGPPKPDRPRMVIIKLHHSRDKPRILAAAKKHGPLKYEDQTIFIRQDLAAPVKEMRRAFNGVCTRLIEKDIKFTMRFPATLTFSHGGQNHSFRSPKDALAFLAGLD